ncbi:MAG: HAMP domain-containing histidine kinase, partial [Firmicutes bacterium]|nr:HAMP domain-containing histidine kinase [Bacillota bacterium]
SLVQRSEMEHYFSVIFNQVKRCKGITRSLLDLNHPEPAPGESLAVGPLLDEALQMVWPRAERQGVRILVFGVAEDVQIVADRRYLLQVLSNLLNNALDALEGRPEPQIQVEVDRVGEGVELIIRDNGEGLGEEARAHIFEPFFTTKPPGKGTGLGLFVAYQLTRKMRGEIALENEPRGGTRARVWFPGGPRDVG